jgi:outer membrane cobalamin receptor
LHLALLALLGPSVAVAQEAPPPPDEREEAPVTITAPRIRQEERSLAGTATVVTREQIERTGAHTLSDLLTWEPGVFVSRAGQLGFGGNLRVRGLGGDPPTEVLITVDGHPSFMGVMGHGLLSAYTLDNVERVEILRGPASALYGTMSMGGVINLVTRSPKGRASFSAQGEYGTYNTREAQTSVGGSGAEWKWLVGWGGRWTDGSNRYAWFRSNSYSARLEKRLSPSATARFTTSTSLYANLDPNDVQDRINAGLLPKQIEQDFDRRNYDLTIDWGDEARAATGSVKLYESWGEHTFGDGFHSKDFVRGLQAQLEGTPTPHIRLVGGFDLQRYGGTILSPAPLAQDFSREENALFTTLRYDLGARDHVGTGLRLVHPSRFESALLPQLGYWHVFRSGMAVRASVRKGYRTPSFRELFLFGINNPNLLPERSWQYEVGANHHFGGWEVDAALFQTSATDFIQLAPRATHSAGVPPVQYLNSQSTTLRGAELTARGRLAPAWGVHGNLSLLDPGLIRAGNYRQKLVLGTDVGPGKWTVNLNASYVLGLEGYDKSNALVKVPSFLVADAKLRYRLRGDLELYLVVENLTNKAYRTDPAYPFLMPGRQVRFGLQRGL